MKRFFFIFVFAGCLSCISDSDKRLSESLKRAGDNRVELEKVLSHYKNDSQKLEAARFLIENMSGHYSVSPDSEEKYQTLYDRHESISIKHNWTTSEEWKQEIDSLEKANIHLLYSTYSTSKISDLTYIKSDWLIQQIDLAFRAWKENVYTRNLSFETFCDFILPYRFRDGIIPNYSRAPFYEKYGYMFRDSTRSFIQAVDSLLYWNRDIQFNWTFGNKIPVYSLRVLQQIKYGQCDEKSWYNCLMFSSCGMAVCTDFVPNRGNRNNAHTWNTLIVNEESYPLEPFWDKDRWNYKTIYNNVNIDREWGKFRIPKVFRNTYSIQREGPLFDKNCPKKNIPGLFRNPRIRDVSEQYFDAQDIDVEISDNAKNLQYVYICVYGNRKWVPVHWGKIVNGQAHFTKMGKDILYIVASYANGKLEPISEPFYLTPEGNIQYVQKTDKTTNIYFHNVGCYVRPAPKKEAVNKILGTLIVGVDSSNNGIDTLGIINEDTDVWENRITVRNNKKYRYIDLYLPSDTVAFNDFVLYQEENGKIDPISKARICTQILPIHKKETLDMITDGISATGFMGLITNKSGREHKLRIDLQEEQEIVSIYFSPYIYSIMKPTCTYKLYYWDNSWIYFGEQKGNDSFLIFNDVPQGALYRIENEGDSFQQGKERVFLYENGFIRWL
ncbi:hypothetical protein [Parabacteroides bouchesdurhonensis]|nr:hypothetical protein [Parabacteroides bouchesdurhonensis]